MGIIEGGKQGNKIIVIDPGGILGQKTGILSEKGYQVDFFISPDEGLRSLAKAVSSPYFLIIEGYVETEAQQESLLVKAKIEKIVREEMDSIGGNEISLTALQQKAVWEVSGRWNDEVMDVWFKTKLASGSELGLAPTHEEPLTSLMRRFINSYKDLPVYPYQFQTKFRNELRSKSGLMRGREFLMKDLYSFSKSQEEHDAFYEVISEAYNRVYSRLGIGEITYKMKSIFCSLFFILFTFSSTAQKGEYIAASISDSLKENAEAVIRLNQIDVVIASQRSMKTKHKRVITVFNEKGLSAIDATEEMIASGKQKLEDAKKEFKA